MEINVSSLPHADGCRIPGEFEKHRQSWMLWPERTDIWPHGAKPAQRVFAQIASQISRYEPITVGVSHRQYQNARARLADDVRVVELSYNGCWIRDTGPIFVRTSSGEIRGVDCMFNAWGGIKEGLYFPWDLDDQIAQKILDMERLKRYALPMVLEGGAITCDGQGTLITTESCVLNPNRNPDLTKAQAEHYFRDYFGVEKVVWLKRGMYLDETGGHVDNLCVFAEAGVVLLTWPMHSSDPQTEISQEALEILSREKDARGRPLKIIKIPHPTPIYIEKSDSDAIDIVAGTVPRPEGGRLPASYINFYFVNTAVLVPTFRVETDTMALTAIKQAFPSRKVIAVDTRDLLFGGGNIHCNVMQQPC